MENTSPLILDGRDGSQSPEDIVDELQAIITDVDAFLSNWFRRLEQGSLSCDPTTIPDLILQKRFKELQNERVLLEAKRKSDERQTQEKAQQLTQAWLQLEEEQRKFLQMKDPPRQAGNEGGSTSSVANRPPHEASAPATAVNSKRTESSLVGDVRPSESNGISSAGPNSGLRRTTIPTTASRN